MPMRTADNQEEIGNNLYFFRSYKEGPEARCLIFAHSGLMSRTQYALPQGLTFTFFQAEHGKPVVTNPFFAMAFGMSGRQGEVVQGPLSIWDYTMGKGVGVHWAHLGWRQRGKPGDYIDYEGISKLMLERVAMGYDWTPHIVVVRHRSPHLINLSQAVPAILNHEQSITQIYFSGCRGEHRSIQG